MRSSPHLGSFVSTLFPSVPMRAECLCEVSLPGITGQMRRGELGIVVRVCSKCNAAGDVLVLCGGRLGWTSSPLLESHDPVQKDTDEAALLPGTLATAVKYVAHAFESWMPASGGVPRQVGSVVPDVDLVLVVAAGAGPHRNGILVLLPNGQTAWANGELFRVVQSRPTAL